MDENWANTEAMISLQGIAKHYDMLRSTDPNHLEQLPVKLLEKGISDCYETLEDVSNTFASEDNIPHQLDDIIISSAILAGVAEILSAANGGLSRNQEGNVYYDAFVAMEETVKGMGAYSFRFSGASLAFSKSMVTSFAKLEMALSNAASALGSATGALQDITGDVSKNSNEFSTKSMYSYDEIQKMEIEVQQAEMDCAEYMDLSNYIRDMERDEWLAYSGFDRLDQVARKDCSYWHISNDLEEKLFFYVAIVKEMMIDTIGYRDGKGLETCHAGRAALKIYPLIDKVIYH